MRLVVKSLATHEMILDDTLQRALSELFRGEAYHHQLHFTEAVRIEPGETVQSLHRDDGTYPFRHPSPPNTINTIWALDDFTLQNGATRVVPYSHLWDDERKPSESEAQPAVMPRGSVMIMDGALYHGGGSNLTPRPRTAVLLGYSLGWLRPLENPQLAVPPQIARQLQKELQDLLGYKSHGFLGSFEGTQPSTSWRDPLADVLPAEDLYGADLEALAVRRR
jgi:ectoine hydroxylase-related dioxygenase (phytanoyl-CoA dioxygenase family)